MSEQIRYETSTQVDGNLISTASTFHRLAILSVDADAVVDNNCILRRSGHDVTLVGTGRAALEKYLDSDIVLLNMHLPDMDAFLVCSTIRSRSKVPVIAIVNTDNELDRVLALRSGADDCVHKSCGFHEVVARIDAIMSRTRPRVSSRLHDYPVLCVGDLTLNVSTRESSVCNQNKLLTEKEFDLLAFLMRSHPAAASRKEIMRCVWKTDWAGSSRTIDTHVSSLRKKLGSNEWITSVRGIGYRLGMPQRSPGRISMQRPVEAVDRPRQSA